MPSLKIYNRSSKTVNLALSHLCPIHFKNTLEIHETWSVQVGSVWFTFECQIDNTLNRYSALRSAQMIGLVSLTGASIALVAIPLAISSLAPVLSSSALMAQIASHNLITAGASSEVLQVTTWIAAALAKTTSHQLAIEGGLSESEIEEKLKNTDRLIDSFKYFTVSQSLLRTAKTTLRSRPSASSPHLPSCPRKDQPLLGLITGGILNQGAKWWGRKSEIETKEPSEVRQQVQGVYIGFDEEYEFEWIDWLNESGEWIGFQLRNVKTDQFLR